VAVVLTLGQTPKIRTNILNKKHKNTVKTIQNTVNTNTHITKTPTRYKTHTYTTHTLQNKLKHPQCKLKQQHYKIYPNEIATI
jgi:hypothetical protein